MIASIHAAVRNNHRKNSEGDGPALVLRTLPLPEDRKHSFQVEMIGINKKWDSRVFVVTANDICIGKADTEVQIDRIPLVDIVNIQGCHHKGGWYQRCMRMKQRCIKAFRGLSESSEDKRAHLSWSAREQSGTQGSITQDSHWQAVFKNSASIISMAVRDSTKAEEMCECVIQTAKKGFNAGRCYRFRTETEEQAIDLANKIRKPDENF